MKTPAPKTTSSASSSQKGSLPFFNTEKEDAFFSAKSVQRQAGNESQTASPFFGTHTGGTPFFTPTALQTKPIFESNGETEEEDRLQRKCAPCTTGDKESLAPKLQFKPLPAHSNAADIQCQCAACQAEAMLPVPIQMQAGAGPSHASSSLENRLNAAKGGGASLSEDTRSSIEPVFGADFSNVRVHTGSSSIQMNEELGAQAFTHGTDVFFNKGKYSPETTQGKELLGHELAHVVQQSAGRVQQTMQAAGMSVNDSAGLEKEADAMGKKVVQKKEHERGCGCADCSKKTGERQPDSATPILQRKQPARPLIQMKSIVGYTFLGERVRGGVHKKLKSRLELVEAELKRQYDGIPAILMGMPTGKPPTLKQYAGLDTISGYSKRKGNHGKGKAVDVNYWNQPYIPTRTAQGSRTTFGGEEGGATSKTRAQRRPAVEVYDRAVSFVKMEGESADVAHRRPGESAKDAYRRFRRTSDALKTYFSLAFHTNYDKVTRAPIADPEAASEADLLKIPTTERKDDTAAIAAISLWMGHFAWRILHPNHPLTPREQYFRVLRDYEIVRKPLQRGKPTKPTSYRNPAKGFLHMPEHFVVAMMDVGKLRWGACEFSATANGDVHHFDLTTPGKLPQPAPMPSGLLSAPAKVLWKVDRKSFPPQVSNLGPIARHLAHLRITLPIALYEMFAHPVVKSGDTYLKVYNKDGSIQFWPTNEYNMVEMPDKLGQRAGKNVLGGRITNYSPDDVETTEGDRYLSPKAAAALINTMGRFQLTYRGAGLEMGDASTSKGRSPRIKAGRRKRHQTHYQGNAFDAHYLDAQGKSQHISAGLFDTNANFDFIRTAIEEGYRYVVIGNKRTFRPLYKKLKRIENKKTYKGFRVVREKHHNDHMHLSFDRKVSKARKKKVKKTGAFEKKWSPLLRFLGVDPKDVFVPFER